MIHRHRATSAATVTLTAACLVGWAAGCRELPDPSGGASTSSRDPGPDQLMKQGEVVYGTSCLTCHQFDGGGVPNLQPAVAGSPFVTGDVETLVRLIYLGVGDPNTPGSLPATGEWAQIMNGFAHLSETEIAAVATYVRGSFGNDASPVTVPEVRRIVRSIKAAKDGGGD